MSIAGLVVSGEGLWRRAISVMVLGFMRIRVSFYQIDDGFSCGKGFMFLCFIFN